MNRASTVGLLVGWQERHFDCKNQIRLSQRFSFLGLAAQPGATLERRHAKQKMKVLVALVEVIVAVVTSGQSNSTHVDGSIVLARQRQCVPPFNTCFVVPTPFSIPNRSVQPFLHSIWQRIPILYNRPPISPSKLSLCMLGDLHHHLIHGSLGPPESTTQTASPPVQPFLHGSWSWQTHRLTDRPRYSTSNNSPHLRTQYWDVA